MEKLIKKNIYNDGNIIFIDYNHQTANEIIEYN